MVLMYKPCCLLVKRAHIMVAKGIILARCDFDMCFIFMACGWDGSMHDSCIFKEIIKNEHALFPHPHESNKFTIQY